MFDIFVSCQSLWALRLRRKSEVSCRDARHNRQKTVPRDVCPCKYSALFSACTPSRTWCASFAVRETTFSNWTSLSHTELVASLGPLLTAPLCQSKSAVGCQWGCWRGGNLARHLRASSLIRTLEDIQHEDIKPHTKTWGNSAWGH